MESDGVSGSDGPDNSGSVGGDDSDRDAAEAGFNDAVDEANDVAETMADSDVLGDVAEAINAGDTEIDATGLMDGSLSGGQMGPTVEAAAALDAGLDPADMALDAAALAGQATTGYTGAMYGDIDLGPTSLSIGDKMGFSRFQGGSSLASPSFNGYGIDSFSKPGLEGYMSRNSIASTQGAFDVASARVAADPNLSAADVTFEARRAGTSRTMDVNIGSGAVEMEVKAGKSINSGQFAQDVAAARAGQAVDYAFTNNPVTGNHGPDLDVEARLNQAVTDTQGRFSWSVEDAGPTAAQMDDLVTASRVSRGARALGRVAGPVGLAADAYSIGSAYQADGGQFGANTTVAVAGSAGGWAGGAAGAWGGAQAGAAVGALGGPIGAAVGGVVGGLIGGIGGAFFGSWGAESAARAAVD